MVGNPETIGGTRVIGIDSRRMTRRLPAVMRNLREHLVLLRGSYMAAAQAERI